MTVLLKVGILVTNNLLNFLNEFRTSENLHFYKDKKKSRIHANNEEKTKKNVNSNKTNQIEFKGIFVMIDSVTKNDEKKQHFWKECTIFTSIFSVISTLLY